MCLHHNCNRFNDRDYDYSQLRIRYYLRPSEVSSLNRTIKVIRASERAYINSHADVFSPARNRPFFYDPYFKLTSDPHSWAYRPSSSAVCNFTLITFDVRPPSIRLFLFVIRLRQVRRIRFLPLLHRLRLHLYDTIITRFMSISFFYSSVSWCF